MSSETVNETVHTQSVLPVQEMLPVMTEEERRRAARWLVNNAPAAFRFSTDSSGYFAAVRTLREGEYLP